MLTTSTQIKSLFTSSVICFLCASQCAFAGLNKWVDEKGNVHYGDRVPPSYLKKEHSLLSEQGVILRTTEAKKSEEELSAEQAERAIKQKSDTKRLIAERKQQLHDRMLLDTFTTEADLVRAIEARVDTVNSQIALAETLIKNDETLLNEVKLQIKSIENSGRKPPENLHKKIKTIGYQMEKNFAYIEDKTNERTEILQTLEKDIKRYRILMKKKHEAIEKAKKLKKEQSLYQ